MKFNVKVELGDIAKKIEKAHERAQYVMDSEVLKDSNYYAPQDQSELINSSIRHSKLGSGELVWDTPYAKRLYYNPQYNFSSDMNPNASGLWFEMAKSNNLNRWIELMDKAMKSEL